MVRRDDSRGRRTLRHAPGGTAEGRRDAVSGHRSFKELRAKVVDDPRRRARVEEIGRAYDTLLALAALRESRGVTQEQMAGTLGVSQPNVSKVERNADVRLSTL